jgi:antitoxin (DNA-binding transcriptional repressor) of toxin-antitoxin stability system
VAHARNGRQSKAVIGAVTRGQRVRLTYRGLHVAVIVPLEQLRKNQRKVADTRAFGMWANREDMADPAAYVARIRAPRPF